MFLKDPFYGYVQGSFTPEEDASPAKILLDLVSTFDRLGKDCQEKLQHYQQVFKALNKEKRDLEGQYYKLELKESEQRMVFSRDRIEAVTSRSTIQHLEAMMMEKNEKIAELQRENNVQLWEREKERVLAEFKTRMETLERTNEELKKQNEVLQKKFATADEQKRMIKMKAEKMLGEIPPQVKKNEEELKRILYLQEKDLTALDRDMLSQQRVFSTVLFGIKTDLLIVGGNLTDPDTGQIPYKDFVRLTGMVAKLATAMANGDLDSARMDNPQLVDPGTDTVIFVNCMKHFTHISVEFIKEHWIKFKEFDGNGDRSLDFAEVVNALSAMGLHFTAQQAKEAMKEADVNNSGSLDFFEYILVVDKIVHKTGKSELFHTNPKDLKVLAKTCVLQ
ncbi:hypothetical protein ACOMHN_024173 [Nucella lapillus]